MHHSASMSSCVLDLSSSSCWLILRVCILDILNSMKIFSSHKKQLHCPSPGRKSRNFFIPNPCKSPVKDTNYSSQLDLKFTKRCHTTLKFTKKTFWLSQVYNGTSLLKRGPEFLSTSFMTIMISLAFCGTRPRYSWIWGWCMLWCCELLDSWYTGQFYEGDDHWGTL